MILDSNDLARNAHLMAETLWPCFSSKIKDAKEVKVLDKNVQV